MVKLGTLYPDRRLDDLGEVNGGFNPGADSARLTEEYGWETLYEDTGAFYASKIPEETEDFRYVFGIDVTDMADACGEVETLWTSELLEGQRFGTKDEAIASLMALEERDKLALKWWDHDEIDGPLEDEDLTEWATEHIEYQDYANLITTLYVVPVSIPESEAKKACGDDEVFESAKKSFSELGDWRRLSWDLNMYGYHVPVASWSSFVLIGDWAPDDLEKAKQAALQIKMLFGFFMDKQVNAIGETGWDWMRNFGIVFEGDPVIWEGHEGLFLIEEKLSAQELWRMNSEEAPGGRRYFLLRGRLVWEDDEDVPLFEDSYRMTNMEGENEVIVPVTEIRALDFRERLLHAKNTSSDSEEG